MTDRFLVPRKDYLTTLTGGLPSKVLHFIYKNEVGFLGRMEGYQLSLCANEKGVEIIKKRPPQKKEQEKEY